MTRQQPWRLLLFGATGAIGGTALRHAIDRGWQVVAASRRPVEMAKEGQLRQACHDPLHGDPAIDLAGDAPFYAVCWAHGANLADSPGWIADYQSREAVA